MVIAGQSAIGLHLGMGDLRGYDSIFADKVGVAKALVRISELKGSFIAISLHMVVNLDCPFLHRFHWVQDHRQGLVVHGD